MNEGVREGVSERASERERERSSEFLGFDFFFFFLQNRKFESAYFFFFLFVAAPPSIEKLHLFLLSPSCPPSAMSSGPLFVASTGTLVLKDLDKEFTPSSTDASATIQAKQKVENSIENRGKIIEKNQTVTTSASPLRRRRPLHFFSLLFALGTRE